MALEFCAGEVIVNLGGTAVFTTSTDRVTRSVMVKAFPAGEFHAFITNVCVPLESFVVSTDALKAPFADGVVLANRVPFSDISRFK
jgi:hypothetical protein